MRRVGAILLALPIALSAAAGPPSDAEASHRKPNVLFIVTDDQRSGLQVMPDTRRLFRRQGVEFANAFATTPLCCPARASILSGRYAHNHGVRRQTEGDNLDPSSTLQHVLRNAGYQTAIFGKYLNGWALDRNPPSFDRWATFLNSHKYEGVLWNVDGTIKSIDEYSTRFIGRRAKRFVREAEAEDARPWFMYLAPPAPHRPFTPEHQYERARVPPWMGNPAVFEEDRTDKPAFVSGLGQVDYETGARWRRKQFRTLMSLDDVIAELFETLEKHRERNTLAVFISDNGYLWGEHGLGRKGLPYTDSIEIPMLLRWPGRVPGGLEDTRLAANIDLYPTVLEAAGLTAAAPHEPDGHSLLDPAWERDRILLEYFRDPEMYPGLPEWASIRTHDWQYVQYYDAQGAPFREYYDLTYDPWQLDNLYGDPYPENDPDAAALTLELEELRKCAGSECP